MKVDKSTIKKVLALFDPEDMPYIHSEILDEYIKIPLESEEKDKIKTKKIGVIDDRTRKQ